MTVTVSDFQEITGISRHTVYSWFYRGNFPKGIKAVRTVNKAKLLDVRSASEHYLAVVKALGL